MLSHAKRLFRINEQLLAIYIEYIDVKIKDNEMKNTKCFFTLLFIGTLFASCDKSDMNYENSFEKSYDKWLSFKETSGNSYRYTVTGSTWVGPAWQTVITVTKGKITQRDFKFTSTGGYDVPQEALEWTENENEINLHKDTPAAAALTLDQIYDKGRNEWLIKRKNTKAYFEANNNGLMSLCGYIEDACADDCFNGISIAYIEPLSTVI